MKKAEIKVGAELFKAAGSNWQTDSYTHRRVVVQDNKFYRQAGSVWSNRQVTDPKGVWVLVRSYRLDNDPTGYLDYVSIAQLRGPFAEVKALVDAARKAKDESDKAHMLDARSLNERFTACIETLALEAVTAHRHGFGQQASLMLNIENAELLCRLLKGEA